MRNKKMETAYVLVKKKTKMLECPICHKKLDNENICRKCNKRYCYCAISNYLEEPTHYGHIINGKNYSKTLKKRLKELEGERTEIIQRKNYDSSNVLKEYCKVLEKKIDAIEKAVAGQGKRKTSKKSVYVYFQLNNKCTVQKHPVISATAKTVDSKTGSKMSVNLYYCKQCKKYYINHEALRLYHKAGKYPVLQYAFDNNSLSRLQDNSLLSLMGYNVKDGLLTTRQRQEILISIINSKILEKQEIINMLQFFVKFNGKKEGNESAKAKWMEDIMFVSTYTDNNTSLFDSHSISFTINEDATDNRI